VNQIYAKSGKFHGVVLPPSPVKKERKNAPKLLSLGAKHNRPEKSREKKSRCIRAKLIITFSSIFLFKNTLHFFHNGLHECVFLHFFA